MAKGPFASARKQIRRTERALRKDRVGDYKRTGDIIDSLFTNLSRTTKSTSRRLTKSQRRELRQMSSFQALQSKAGRKSEARLSSFNEKMGLGGHETSAWNERDLRAANAQAAGAGRRGQKSLQGEFNMLQPLLKMGRQTARETEAAAEYAAAQALDQRGQDDAATTAQMRFELAQQKLEHRLAIEQMEYQAELNEKAMEKEAALARKEIGTQAMSIIGPQLGLVQQLTPEVINLARAGTAPGDIMDKLVEDGTIDEVDMNNPVVKSLIRQLTTDTQKGADTDKLGAEAIEVLSMLPEWAALTPAQKKRLRKILQRGFGSIELRRMAAESKQSGYGGSIETGGAGPAWGGNWMGGGS